MHDQGWPVRKRQDRDRDGTRNTCTPFKSTNSGRSRKNTARIHLTTRKAYVFSYFPSFSLSTALYLPPHTALHKWHLWNQRTHFHRSEQATVEKRVVDSGRPRDKCTGTRSLASVPCKFLWKDQFTLVFTATFAHRIRTSVAREN